MQNQKSNHLTIDSISVKLKEKIQQSGKKFIRMDDFFKMADEEIKQHSVVDEKVYKFLWTMRRHITGQSYFWTSTGNKEDGQYLTSYYRLILTVEATASLI